MERPFLALGVWVIAIAIPYGALFGTLTLTQLVGMMVYGLLDRI